jgi:hypothetical protein
MIYINLCSCIVPLIPDFYFLKGNESPDEIITLFDRALCRLCTIFVLGMPPSLRIYLLRNRSTYMDFVNDEIQSW